MISKFSLNILDLAFPQSTTYLIPGIVKLVSATLVDAIITLKFSFFLNISYYSYGVNFEYNGNIL